MLPLQERERERERETERLRERERLAKKRNQKTDLFRAVLVDAAVAADAAPSGALLRHIVALSLFML